MLAEFKVLDLVSARIIRFMQFSNLLFSSWSGPSGCSGGATQNDEVAILAK